MISKARRSFWERFDELPSHVQHQARSRFQLWRREPFHSSLHFKNLFDDLWSVRVNNNYRALALREGELVAGFWIGPHAEYDRLIGGG